MKRFTQTSDQPYIRHNYKLVDNTGKYVIFDNYQDAQETWWKCVPGTVSHIEVLDKN